MTEDGWREEGACVSVCFEQYCGGKRCKCVPRSSFRARWTQARLGTDGLEKRLQVCSRGIRRAQARGSEGEEVVAGQEGRGPNRRPRQWLCCRQVVGCEGGLECFSTVRCPGDDIEYMVPKTTRQPSSGEFGRPTAENMWPADLWRCGCVCFWTRRGTRAACTKRRPHTAMVIRRHNGTTTGFLFQTTLRNRVLDTVAAVADGPPVCYFLSGNRRKDDRAQAAILCVVKLPSSFFLGGGVPSVLFRTWVMRRVDGRAQGLLAMGSHSPGATGKTEKEEHWNDGSFGSEGHNIACHAETPATTENNRSIPAAEIRKPHDVPLTASSRTAPERMASMEAGARENGRARLRGRERATEGSRSRSRPKTRSGTVRSEKMFLAARSVALRAGWW